jgi:molybdate transport system regulatory protein
MARLTIRVDFDSGASIGPGKIRLLEEVERSGSIRKAAEALDMSFRQSWLLLKAIDEMFGEQVIVTSRGGAKGGGSALTELGRLVVSNYRQLEREAALASQSQIASLEARVAGAPGGPKAHRKKISRK